MSGYAPEGRVLWDPWFAWIDGRYLMYHLDAPRTDDPEDRHERATIRVASSTDLHSFDDLGPALESGPAGAWDDGPIWTGSTLVRDDGVYLFYTGRNQRDGDLQRIGLARSQDGAQFERGATPLLEPDPRWYETTEVAPIIKAWRDPFVFEHGGRWYMFFTARTKTGHPAFKGCIGAAVAEQPGGPWQVLPPVLAPGGFAQMEVPQVIQHGGRFFLFFSAMEKDYAPSWADAMGGAQCGLQCWTADDLLGPYQPQGPSGVVLGTESGLYSVRLVERQDHAPVERLPRVAIGFDLERLRTCRPRDVRWSAGEVRIAD